MNDHYFRTQPTAPHRYQTWSDALRGRELRFITDSAVFSRHRVDPGSRLLIETVPLPEHGYILDLGCGYGPVGLALAAAAPSCRVILVDVNERAADLARRNLAVNALSNAEVRTGDGLNPVQDLDFQLIATNPPIRAGKALLFHWIEEARARLAPGGCFALVARTRQGVRSLARRVEEVFGNVEEPARGSGYRVIQAWVPRD